MSEYTTEELIAFGNYILSDKRNEMVKEKNKKMVHDADVANFNDEQRKQNYFKAVGDAIKHHRERLEKLKEVYNFKEELCQCNNAPCTCKGVRI